MEEGTEDFSTDGDDEKAKDGTLLSSPLGAFDAIADGTVE